MRKLDYEEIEVALRKHVHFGQCYENGKCDKELLGKVATELKVKQKELKDNCDFKRIVSIRWFDE